MFSGIVREVGTVEELKLEDGLLELSVSSKLNNLSLGDSISHDGCCLTVTEVDQNIFKVQATEETLNKTTFSNLKKGSKINLEPSLRLGDSLDGHLVSGHVDTIGEIKEIISNEENRIVKIEFANEYRSYIAPKGSITVNGVSLTVVDVESNFFTFTLIPYTRDNTNLGLLSAGDKVNLEMDLISRYLVNYLDNKKELIKS